MKKTASPAALFAAIETSDLAGFYKALTAASINAKSTEGDTPLLLSLKLGEMRMSEELIARGADMTITDAEGRSVFDIISLIAADYQEMLMGYKRMVAVMGLKLKAVSKDAPLKVEPEQIWASKKQGNVIELPTDKRKFH